MLDAHLVFEIWLHIDDDIDEIVDIQYDEIELVDDEVLGAVDDAELIDSEIIDDEVLRELEVDDDDFVEFDEIDEVE